MKKRIALALSAIMATGMIMAGCGSTSSAPAQGAATADSTAAATSDTVGGMEGGTDLKFTTGGDQGTYYGFGGVLASKVSETTSTNVTAIASGGSQANIEYIDLGDADLGFVQSDVMAYAYDGTRLFEETGKVESFSTVAALYMEQVQVVSVDPSITSIADLKGKNVSIGAPGSGTYFNALDVLEVYGLTETDINATYQSFGDSAEALQDGWFHTGNDVSEADVYNFLYGVFENVDSITAAHAKGAELDLDFAASVGSVPYHPGAAKYFSEKGIEVPTK